MKGINTDTKDNDILIAAVSISLIHASSLGSYSGCCFSSEGHPYSSVWLFLCARAPVTFSPGLFDTQFCFCCCLLCCAQSLQSCPTLRPMDCSPPGSSVYGILQARILEWVAMPSSRGSSQPRNRTSVSCSSCNAGGFFIIEPLEKPKTSSNA